MIYNEYMPIKKLMNYIQCIWVINYNDNYSTNIQFIPDGYFDLLFVFKNNELDKIRLIGICSYSDIIEYNTKEIIIGIRMHLMAIKTIIDIPINELVNTSIILSTKELQISIDAVNRAFRDGTFLAYIQSYFLERHKANRNEQLFYDINRYSYSVNTIASKTGYSERQIHRLFIQEIGISPKSYLGIIRLRNYLSNYRDEYYDDSHKIRNFMKFIGNTPSLLKHSNVRFVQYSWFFNEYT